MGFGICPLGSQMILWSRKSCIALAPQLLKTPGIPDILAVEAQLTGTGILSDVQF